MPSGRTHDRITLWSLPLVAGTGLILTRSGNLTLLMSGGFLFSGLMFGPDLDIHSRQYLRWGWLRWIWIPYQRSLGHRSFLSHGPVVGTLLRVAYLAGMVGWVVVLGATVALLGWNIQLNWLQVRQTVEQAFQDYSAEGFFLFIGLELGAMSHSLSDWIGSSYKRFKKQGKKGLNKPASRSKKIRSRSKSQMKRKK
jgi:uncharacterized metal-binding protein